MNRTRSRLRMRCWWLMLALMLPPVGSDAQIGPWRTFTNQRDVQKLLAQENTLWAATTGGLFALNPASDSTTSYTNEDGLSNNDVVALAADALGRIWIGLSNGMINILEPQSGTIQLILDYEGFTINHMLVFGDTVYIGLNIGVGEYRISKEEPKELYRQLGINISREIPANTLIVRNNALYVGTREGIARASLNLPNLKAPQSWVNFSTADGLPSDRIRDFVVWQGRVVAATADGVALENGAGWQDISSGLPRRDIIALAVHNEDGENVLYAASRLGVYRRTLSGSWQTLPTAPGSVNDILVHKGVLWAAIQGQGLARFIADTGQWQVVRPGGPKSNLFSSVFFDPQTRVLWCTSSKDGVFAFDGQKWYDLEALGPLHRGDYRSVVVDEAGRVWVGSWGRGLLLIEGDLQNPTITKFDTTGGFLSGSTPRNAAFVVINDLALDRNGVLWMSNFDALNGRAVAARTPDGQWAYFSIARGLRFKNLTRIFPDSFGRVWYGSESAGIEVIDYGGTLLDPTDDQLALGIVESSQLFSQRITGIAEDRDGTIWIGTPEGLHYVFNDRLNNFFGTGAGNLISPNIRSVRIDPANNKWIGTSAGVTVLMADNFNLMHFTTDNSPIVSNSIVDFAFDPETGDVFIATTNGLSVVRTPFTAPQADFSLLKGYPNPLILNSDGGEFIIKNLMERSGVTIFNEMGRLIRSYAPGTIPGSQVIWDGRDQNGEIVPSGIYIYVAYTEDGAKAAGKVAVIRK